MNALRRIFAITRKEIQILFARPLERRIIVLPPVILMFVFSWAATREVRNVDVEPGAAPTSGGSAHLSVRARSDEYARGRQGIGPAAGIVHTGVRG